MKGQETIDGNLITGNFIYAEGFFFFFESGQTQWDCGDIHNLPGHSSGQSALAVLSVGVKGFPDIHTKLKH